MCGFTSTKYNGTNTSLVLLATPFLVQARIRLASVAIGSYWSIFNQHSQVFSGWAALPQPHLRDNYTHYTSFGGKAGMISSKFIFTVTKNKREVKGFVWENVDLSNMLISILDETTHIQATR